MRRRQAGRQAGRHSIANLPWLAGWLAFCFIMEPLCVVPFLSDALLDSVGAALALWSGLCTHQQQTAGGQIYDTFLVSLSVVVVV